MQRSSSLFAEGSAFSWITRLADVCRTKTVHKPSAIFAFPTADLTCPVISSNPWPCVSTVNWSIIRARFKRFDGGQLLALEKLQEGAAGGGDVVDLVRNAELVDRG